MASNQVRILIHCHQSEQFQMEKRLIKLLSFVKIHYHLHCQKYPDISSANENTSSTELMAAIQV